MQISAVLAMSLFDRLGVMQVSSLRFALAAIVLLIVFRPRLRGRSRREWLGIILYGVALAAMNVSLYLAIDRIPLGIATTLEFPGPRLVALAASRHMWEVLLAVAALGGVALIAGLGGPLDLLGMVFAAIAAACFGLYTVLAAKIGKSSSGIASVALSVSVAAIVTLPISVSAAPQVQPADWGMRLTSATIGMALASVVDTLAARLTSARVLGVFFAFDPMVGTILGVLWLGQVLTLSAFAGIALVVFAGAGIVWLAGRRETTYT